MPLRSLKYTPVDVRFNQLPSTESSLQTRNQYYMAAIQRQNKVRDDLVDSKATIAATLNALPVHESEQGWLDDYAYATEEKINNYIRQGDYDSALYAARTLAKTALTDPAVTSRVKRNAAFEAEKNKVLADKDLDAVTKQRWEEENDYTTGLSVDDKGRVNEWNAAWNPVKPVDLTSIYEEVKKLVAPEKGNSNSASFLDENGKLTNDVSKGFYGLAVQTTTGWERVSEARLRNAFDALFKEHPEYMQAIMQDMDDRKWQYDKASDEDKKAFWGSDIMDENGELYSPQQYIEKRVSPVLHEMSYNHVVSNVNYGSAFSNKLTDDRAKAAAAAKAAKDVQDKQALANLMGLNTTVAGPNIEIPLGEKAAGSYSILMDNLKEVANIAPNFYASPEFKQLLQKGDYNAIADKIMDEANKTYSYNANLGLPMAKKKLGNIANIANLLRSEGEIFNSITSGMDKSAIDAITFSSAVDSNMPLPTNNLYSRQYADIKNRLFSYVDDKGKSQTGNAIGIVFQDDNQKFKVLDYLKASGIGQELFAENGVKLDRTEDGRSELKVSKNSPLLSDIATAMAANDDRFWSFNRSKINVYDDINSYNAHDMNSQEADAWGIHNRRSTSILEELSKDGDLLLSARNEATAAYKLNPNANMVTPLQVLPYDDYNTMSLTEMWMKGSNDFLNTTNYKELVSQFQDNNIKAFSSALANPGNQVWYGDPDNTGTARQLTQEEINTYKADIQAALTKNQVEISPGDAPTRSGFGTLVKIKKLTNTKGETVVPDKYFYIDGLLRNEAALAYANNPDVMNRKVFKEYRAMGIPIQDLDGNIINYSNEESLSDFVLAKNLESATRDINSKKGTSEELTSDKLQLAALLFTRDYIFGTADNNALIEKVKQERGVSDEEAVAIIRAVQQGDEFSQIYQKVLGKLYGVAQIK